MSFRNSDKNSVTWDHYLHLMLRKWWIVVPVFLVVLLLWSMLMLRMNMLTPEQEASAVLRFDDPQTLSAVDERVGYDYESRTVLVKSRSFLQEVAQKLSLQLMTDNAPRSEVFDSVHIGPQAPVGSYTLMVGNRNYRLEYSNNTLGIERKIVEQGPLSQLRTTRLPGVYLCYSERFRQKPFTVTFTVTRLRDAVDWILSNLDLRITEPLGTIVTITLSGRDYPLIAKTVNTIADDFVRNNSGLSHSRKSEILTVLQQQLQMAQKEMQQAQQQLRTFRNANPTVGVPDAMPPPASLSDLHETEAQLRSYLLQARSLRSRYDNTSSAELSAVLYEMVSFLFTHSGATAAGLQRELDYLTARQQLYHQEYSPSHPYTIENRNRLRQLGRKVDGAMEVVGNNFSRRINEYEIRISRMNKELTALPSKEIRYGELNRLYEVNAQIYATILSRYNEAKITGAIEVGYVSVLDHAVEPEGRHDLRFLMMIIGAGLLLSMTAAVGPLAVMDSFDRRAQTEKDLKRLTTLPLLEAIPVKGRWKSDYQNRKPLSIDPKLVAPDYTHNFVDQTYRSLRAKLLLTLFDQRKRRILITSLNTGEGKSFTSANLAITMAQQNIPTLLIDGDIRRGLQHRHFGLEKKTGLSDILLSDEPLSASVLESHLSTAHIENLFVLSCGFYAPNSAELLNSRRFRDLLKLCSEHFGMVIMDSSPLAATTDAIGIMDSFDRYLVVVRAGHTNVSHLNRKVKEYPGLKDKILGVIFNGAPYKRSEYYQYNSYRY